MTRQASTVRVREQAIARPALPKTIALSPARMQTVDLEERMEPLAVSEAIAERDQSPVGNAVRMTLVALTAVGVWFLLPAGRAARPPIELPAALQGDVQPSKEQRRAEAAAIAVLEQVGPRAALEGLRRCVEAPDASHEAWRFYLGTLAQLGDGGELATAAATYTARHPDRLESPHFSAEAIRLSSPADRRDADAWFVSRASPVFLEGIDACLRHIDTALAMLQQRADDWPARDRQKWADVLHLDRAVLHRVLWQCHGDAFDDAERDRILESLDDVSNADAENVLELRAEVYEKLVSEWPRLLGWERKNVTIGGRVCDRGMLRRELEACREGLRKLPPKGTR